jgi:hypothetical protein
MGGGVAIEVTGCSPSLIPAADPPSVASWAAVRQKEDHDHVQQLLRQRKQSEYRELRLARVLRCSGHHQPLRLPPGWEERAEHPRWWSGKPLMLCRKRLALAKLHHGRLCEDAVQGSAEVGVDVLRMVAQVLPLMTVRLEMAVVGQQNMELPANTVLDIQARGRCRYIKRIQRGDGHVLSPFDPARWRKHTEHPISHLVQWNVSGLEEEMLLAETSWKVALLPEEVDQCFDSNSFVSSRMRKVVMAIESELQ